ncbi:MAG: patatin-like phospholipase family protein [Caldilineaceae bacterium]|nr:patatin-like phospholipase family protein [Caldilineaceae bacterium]
MERSAYPFPRAVWDQPPAPRHVGLALGGGAARGLAHIGVLEVLEEAEIPIHRIAGCSAGSVVGALFAAGISAKQMHELALDLRWNTLSTLSLLPRRLSLNVSLKGFPLGLLDLDKLITWLEGLLTDTPEFADLRLPFAAIATDIVTSELVIMNDGAVGPAVRASCSVPGVFTPYRRGERLLVDGGVVANLPVQVVRQMGAEYVIAVNVLPLPGEHRKEPENIVDLTLTSLYALIRANQGYGERAECMIAPDIAHFSLIDLSAAEGLIAAGRAAAEAQLPTIQHDLGLQTHQAEHA